MNGLVFSIPVTSLLWKEWLCSVHDHRKTDDAFKLCPKVDV